jgi:uncharacterized protein YndB with AHSA1/START domain
MTDQEASPMPSAQRTLVIMRPVDAVFAFFTDPANDPKWRSQVKEIRAEGAPAVGSRIHQVVAGPGRGIPADLEITGYEPNARYAFAVVAGPVRPQGEFRFAPTAEGGTEVTFSLNAELTGLKKLLMSRPVQKSMDGELAGLDEAKRLLETSTA